MSKTYTLQGICKKCGEEVKDHSYHTLDDDGRLICEECGPGRPKMMVPNLIPRCGICKTSLEDKESLKLLGGEYCLKLH